MKTFEYESINLSGPSGQHFDPEALLEAFDEAGADGYELVAVTKNWAYFKREVQSDAKDVPKAQAKTNDHFSVGIEDALEGVRKWWDENIVANL